MMELPFDMVMVGPYRYGIKFDAEYTVDYGHMATYFSRSRKIKLSTLQADTEVPQTILHECLHAIGHVWEIDVLEEHTKNAENKTIDKIDLMATALLQFLRDNPLLVKFVMESR